MVTRYGQADILRLVSGRADLLQLLDSLRMSAWPYRVTTKYSYYYIFGHFVGTVWISSHCPLILIHVDVARNPRKGEIVICDCLRIYKGFIWFQWRDVDTDSFKWSCGDILRNIWRHFSRYPYLQPDIVASVKSSKILVSYLFVIYQLYITVLIRDLASSIVL